MSSKKRRKAQAMPQRTSRPGPRPTGSSSAASAHPVMVAVITAIVTAIVTAGISVPTSIYVANRVHQGAANEATVQAEYAALSHDAELVDFGLGTAPDSSSPEVVITNRSSGWIRNLTLLVPVSVRKTTNSDGSASISVPAFTAYANGGSGGSGIWGTPDGIFLRDPLPDIGPCELVVTPVVKELPSVTRAALAASQLDFTDPNGNAWTRSGSGELVRNTGQNGPGTWSSYVVEEPIPGCSAG